MWACKSLKREELQQLEEHPSVLQKEMIIKVMGKRLGVVLVLLYICCFTVFVDADVGAAVGGVALPFRGLELHYYKINNTCTYAEEFINHQVTLAWKSDRSITPALLRLLYSDCFITGCDASILLDGENSEKTAPQNAGLRGFEVIDRIKRVMEARCPGVVSCSDILQLATRDAVALAGAPKYPVFTGRKDGKRSNVTGVDLPSPSISWDQALLYFQSRGLDVLDLGTLLGAHTVGKTHCSYIYDRLYNFNGTGRPDPSMDKSFLVELRKQCIDKNQIIFLNPESGNNYNFTNSFYSRVLKKQAVLGIDQQFLFSRDGIRIADEFAAGFEDLRRAFALAMSRMGSIGVLTGNQGEVRRSCRYTNDKYPSLN